jgi:S-adenosylmethionine hydrolase
MIDRIISLTSDFGLRDPYVAEMKAVILNICPNATIVDVSHEIEKFSVRSGAYVLACASRYFQKNAIHVAVIDPEVGTERRPVVIDAKTGFFVGPDNGVLALAAKKQDIRHVYEITNRKLMLPRISNTFHGRDIFAPAAAHLANGISPADFGPEIDKITCPSFSETIREKDKLVGEVVYTDDFGNIITNFDKKELKPIHVKQKLKIELGKRKLKLRLCRTYAEAKINEPLATIGSHNFLEISVNQGNAAKTFRVRIGDKVVLHHFDLQRNNVTI